VVEHSPCKRAVVSSNLTGGSAKNGSLPAHTHPARRRKRARRAAELWEEPGIASELIEEIHTARPLIERLITHAYRTIKCRSWTPLGSRCTVDGMDRMLDRFIDRWLRWEHERDARRMRQWKRHMYRDPQSGTWRRDERFGIW
jgi:hypothetical protein